MPDMNTGKGKDRKGNKTDGLVLGWKWYRQRELIYGKRDDERRLPCQYCFALVIPDSYVWMLRVIDHYRKGYEARVMHDGMCVADEMGLPTRLDAQLKAEELIIKHIEDTAMAATRTLKEIESIMC